MTTVPFALAPDPVTVRRSLERSIGAGWVRRELSIPMDVSLWHQPSHTDVLVSIAPWDSDETLWIHASIAHPDRLPSYDELKALHAAAFGDRHAFQVFTPSSRHVNIHAHALHLWGRADGVNPLPDFGALGTI